MKFRVVVSSLLLSGTAALGAANPFVTLYEQRVELAKLRVEQGEVEVRYDLDRLQRGLKLYQRHAIALEELNQLRRAHELAVVEAKALRIRVAAAEAELEAVKGLVQTGTPVPLCPDLAGFK